MESKTMYNKLESDDDSFELRNATKIYLNELIQYRNEHLDQSRAIAYEIAGLLSTKLLLH